MPQLTPQQSKELDEQIWKSLGFQYGLTCERCPKFGRKTPLGLREALESFEILGFILCLTCLDAGIRAGKDKRKI